MIRALLAACSQVSMLTLLLACGSDDRTLTGQLGIIIADDFDNFTSETTYHLYASEGAAYELLLDEIEANPGLLELVNVCFGGIIRVSGTVSNGGEVHVRSLKVVEPPGFESGGRERIARCRELAGR